MLPEIKTILYATDLGPGAPHVFRLALGLAQQYDAKIVIVKAAEPLSTFGQSQVELHISHADGFSYSPVSREQVRASIAKRLHAFCLAELERADDVEQRVADIRVVDGQPCEVILEQARTSDADLIVLGSHRHSATSDALLGTTTQKVLHRSELPVLVARISAAEGTTGI